jgi:[ribosomal protein S5]-alanine N-acetyltransferase
MLEPNFEPFPEIRTTRLVLRKILPADAEAIFALRTQEVVMKYIDKEPMKTIEEAKALVEKITADIDNNNGINWCICIPGNEEQLIGLVSFWRIIKQNYRAEIGYMLHPDYWRKGLMEEAVKAVIAFGFTSMRLHSIEAHINPANAGSAGLLEKLGFVREAYFKEDYYFKGQFLDTAIYSLLNA